MKEFRSVTGTCLRFLTPVLVLVATFTPAAVAERRERLIDSWRPIHYDVTLTLNEALSEVSSARANVTVLFLKDSVTAIDLDFGDMPIDAVSVDGKAAPFERRPDKLVVSLATGVNKGARSQIAVTYHGIPKEGLVLTNDNDGKPAATGDNWPDRVHHWIPSLDHPSAKATVRFTVTAGQSNLVVANGRLVSTRSNSDKTQTWVWHESVPISPYCMIIAVGQFVRISPQSQPVTPLAYYVPKSERGLAMKASLPQFLRSSIFRTRSEPTPTKSWQ